MNYKKKYLKYKLKYLNAKRAFIGGGWFHEAAAAAEYAAREPENESTPQPENQKQNGETWEESIARELENESTPQPENQKQNGETWQESIARSVNKVQDKANEDKNIS